MFSTSLSTRENVHSQPIPCLGTRITEHLHVRAQRVYAIVTFMQLSGKSMGQGCACTTGTLTRAFWRHERHTLSWASKNISSFVWQ